MSQFDIKAIRRVYSQFPTGVTVMTTVTSDGESIGMTASSFNTVSIDPPLILWSIDKGAYSLSIFEHCQYFAVNILSENQVDISNRFAGRGEDKFQGINYTKGLGDCPLLANTLAQMECSKWAVYEGGDHLIIVGEVKDFRLRENQSPLVFSQGSYAQTVVHAMSESGQSALSTGQKSFLDNHLLYLLRNTYNTHSQQLYQQLAESSDVTAEAWRVFACLADGEAVSLSQLADWVMQPQDVLQETLGRIGDKQLTVDNDSQQVKLTSSGVRLSQKLLAVAQDYESSLAEKLGESQFATLKEQLRDLNHSS